MLNFAKKSLEFHGMLWTKYRVDLIFLLFLLLLVACIITIYFSTSAWIAECSCDNLVAFNHTYANGSTPWFNAS